MDLGLTDRVGVATAAAKDSTAPPPPPSAPEGAKVVLNARNTAALDELAATMPNAIVVACDITDPPCPHASPTPRSLLGAGSTSWSATPAGHPPAAPSTSPTTRSSIPTTPTHRNMHRAFVISAAVTLGTAGLLGLAGWAAAASGAQPSLLAGSPAAVTSTAVQPPVASIVDSRPSVAVGASPVTVRLDGSRSSDPNGYPLTFAWTSDCGVPFDNSSSSTPSLTFGPIGYGQKMCTAHLTVNNGSLSASTDVTITLYDNTAPAAPVITAPATGSSTSNQTPPINGTSEPHGTVTLSDSETAVGTVVAAQDGTWQLQPQLAGGTHHLTATVSNPAGTSGPSNQLDLTVTPASGTAGSNGRILYAAFIGSTPGSQIFAVDPFGGPSADLSGAIFGDDSPAVSPSGDKIAFRHGGAIWLMNIDGSDRHEIGIFSYGDATFFGSTGSTILNKQVVGMAA